MNRLTLILIFALTYGMVNSQPPPKEIKFSSEIEKGLADGLIRSTRAGTLYSFIGEYYTAARYSDIPVSWGIDSLVVDNYILESALPHVVDQARSHQIVIISENHLRPQHRIFAKNIIEELSKEGFGHLGLETFGHRSNSNELLDSNLLERGYPLDSPLTGTYTLEPKMGDLVRTALKLKYIPFAYEESEKVEGKDRDEIQADNIIKYLNSNPGAKIIIVCGFHHAIESDVIKRRSSYWMAKYLKDKTGIDPLTIYQDNFTEKFSENEHPFLKDCNIHRPSVFTDSKGEMIRMSDHVDVEIVHPITRYRNGRPNWMYENGDCKSVPIKMDRSETKFPVIVSAHLKSEQNGVPTDRIELRHRYDNKVLVLRKGEYLVKVYDGENSIEYIEDVE